MIRVFFDANIYFSAARSLLGGSALITEFVKKKKLLLFTTPEVLKEAETNLRLKENVQVLVRYYQNLSSIKPKIIRVSKKQAKIDFGRIINQKDALVLAGAKKTRVKYLVILDKKHFFTKKIKRAKLFFKILTPGDLIKQLTV